MTTAARADFYHGRALLAAQFLWQLVVTARQQRPDVIAAWGGPEEIRAAPIIPAAGGFMVLAIYFDGPETRRVSGYTTYAVIGWRMVADYGALPVVFGTTVEFFQMCELALQDPSGSVNAFDGGWFPSAEEWLRNRQRELRRRP
jgi:hypothetical protein